MDEFAQNTGKAPHKNDEVQQKVIAVLLEQLNYFELVSVFLTIPRSISRWRAHRRRRRLLWLPR